MCGCEPTDFKYNRCFIDRKEREISPAHLELVQAVAIFSRHTCPRTAEWLLKNKVRRQILWRSGCCISTHWSHQSGVAVTSVDVVKDITPQSVQENAQMTQTNLRPKRNKMYMSQPIRKNPFILVYVSQNLMLLLSYSAKNTTLLCVAANGTMLLQTATTTVPRPAKYQQDHSTCSQLGQPVVMHHSTSCTVTTAEF